MSTYEAVETLFQGRACTVVRARSSRGPAVLKRLSSQSSAADRARLRYEHKLLSQLAEDGARNVVRPLELFDEQGVLTLALRDVHGASLTQLQPHGAWRVADALWVGMEVAQALIDVHRAGIVHKDINPNNIVVQRDKSVVELIDFGIASTVPREMQNVETTRQLEGTLAYMAPEQTGRMNRALDYRCDFFSLGATLYALLAGRLPFDHHDVGRAVYALLAEEPPPLQQVPQAVQDIVAKCMAKAPEERYLSAAGLHHDLQRAAADFTRLGDAPAFTLGERDVSEVFSISDRLVGRTAEVRQLVEAWQSTAPDGRRLAVVKGASGVGKTSLIGALWPNIVQAQGTFAAGKYDQLQRHVPFSALSHALGELCKRLLLEPAAVLDTWRRRLQVALGNVGLAVTELCPAVELIVGPQKSLPSLAPTETENRLVMVFSRLLLALCRQTPLALFFDDIQWADAGTLRVLKALLQSSDPGRLLLIVAFRDNEVGPTHAVQVLLDDLSKAGHFPALVQVGPLEVAALAEWVAECAHCTPQEALPLAELVRSKTSGNPFLVRDALQRFYEQKLLNFANGRWRWNLQDLAASSVSAGVADSMLTHLAALPLTARLALGCGACLGVEFQSAQVAAACGVSHYKTLQDLAVAQRSGLLFALDDDYRWADLQGDPGDMPFRFAHDKVQQAAYEQLGNDERLRLHLAIGFLHRTAHQASPPGAWLFDLAHHLNQASALLTELPERVELARVNAMAAKESLRAGTASVTEQFCQHGWAALGDDGWRTAYPVMRELQLAHVRACVLSGNLEQARQTLQDLLPRVRNDDEYEEAQHLLVDVLAAQNKTQEAFWAATAALAKLGVPFDGQAGMPQMLRQLLLLQWELRGKTPAGLSELAFGDDPAMQRFLTLAEACANVGRQVNANYLAVCSLYFMRLVLRRGLQPGSADTFIIMVLISATRSDWAAARQWAQSVRRCVQRDQRPLRALSRFLILIFVDYLDIRPQRLVEMCDEIINAALEEGNPLVATYPMAIMEYLLTGVSIPEAIACGTRVAPHMRIYFAQNDEGVRLHTESVWHWLANANEDPGALVDDDTLYPTLMTMDVSLRKLIAEVRTLYNLLTGNDAQAVRYGVLAVTSERIDMGELLALRSRFFCCVALTQQAQRAGRRRVNERRVFARALKKIRGVSQANPEIHGGLHRLLQAEYAAMRGQHAEAMLAYDQAVHQLSTCGTTAFAMVGAECAARYCLRRGQRVAAAAFVQQALEFCRVWGALRKAALLRVEFTPVLAQVALTQNFASPRAYTTGSASVHADVDLPALLHVASAMCEEVQVERIAHMLLEQVQRTAGATRAVLLLQHPDGLHPVADTAPVPRGIAEELTTLVLRSKEPVLVADVARHTTADAYWAQSKVKCALACPLLHQGAVLGVLILENQLSTGVFTPERLTLVRLMTRQSAIALHNAQVLQNLDAVVAEKTAQLQTAHARVVKLEREATESQMAGGFAHEMRNALAGARYPLEYLHDTAQTLGEQAGQEALQNFHEALSSVVQGIEHGLRITDLIVQYADVSHVVAGDDRVTLRTVVDDVLQSYQQRLGQLHAEARVDIDPTLQALARREHATTIVRNLIDNACDALQDGERTGQHLSLHAEIRGGQVLLQVRDTGVGIPVAAQVNVFRPFYSTKGARGHGLGLGLSRKLAQAYGGDLRFESEAGRGSMFELWLPRVGD